MNYYNEFDHNAAEWLRELIAEGLIPKGEVDERSIADVGADELRGYTQCHFFAGVGGWSLALRLAGWPDERPVWTGSCPCQAFSTAGKQLGFSDERDLWPVFANLIRECRPECVFGEQVENAIRHGWLDRVYADLEAQGYAVGAHVLGAHSVGAPHRRYRLYWGGVSVADMSVHGHTAADGLREATESSEQTGSDGKWKFARSSNHCGVAKNSDGGGCGWRNDGDHTGSGWEVQAPGLGDGGGVADDKRIRPEQREHRQGSRHQSGLSAGSCVAGGVGDADGTRLERRNRGCECADQCAIGASSMVSISPWSSYRFVYCRDGKVRRIPAESILLGVADGVPGELDGGGVAGISEVGGFPLTTQKEGRAMLLKGYGNAIVPQVAAEFVAAFMRGME